MDLRTRTSLFCGALALAIAASILLRGGGRRRAHLFFAAFAADIGLWYIAQWLYHFVRADVWVRFTAVLAVLLPQFALSLFEVIVPRLERRSTLVRVAGVLMIPMLLLVLSPQHDHGLVRGSIMLYVFGLMGAGLWSLAIRGERSRSRATQKRVRFLVVTGAAAAAFTLADFLWFVGAPLPPVGAVLSIVFLFVLSESMIRDRLVDLYDILGQLLVSTALAFLLAGIFYVFVVLVGGFNTMYLNAILASIVILVLFEPLRDKVEQYIHKAFFLERVDLERAVSNARRELVHVLQVSEMLQVVASQLEASRRATGAALYLRDPLSSDFELGMSFGPVVPPRLDGAAARPLLERLSASSSLLLEELTQDAAERRKGERNAELEADERVIAAAGVLGPFKDGVVSAIRGEDRSVVGLLCLMDDRVSDAFSQDDVALLDALAVQVGVVIENSRQYRRMQERDRLAALGQLAAGLAHEVKNPLGAIKGAAQLLNEPGHGELDASSKEFLGIILEEVDRLDRVVGSVLDYARPAKGNPGAVDVNAVVRRTLQVLSSERREQTLDVSLDETLPPVRVDAEQLRQVLMNLMQNALQAGATNVRVSTALRPGARGENGGASRDFVEIAVRDDGPGIPSTVLDKLFVPFFTTKDRGTGLGLAISQRMVEEMGGRIDVASLPGAGATFTVAVPADAAAARPSLVPSLEASPPPPPTDAEVEPA